MNQTICELWSALIQMDGGYFSKGTACVFLFLKEMRKGWHNLSIIITIISNITIIIMADNGVIHNCKGNALYHESFQWIKHYSDYELKLKLINLRP